MARSSFTVVLHVKLFTCNVQIVHNLVKSIEAKPRPGFTFLRHSLFSIQTKKQPWYNSTLASRRKRLTAHFEDLEQCYFSTRMTRVSGEFLLCGVQLLTSVTSCSPQNRLAFDRTAFPLPCRGMLLYIFMCYSNHPFLLFLTNLAKFRNLILSL